MERDNRIMQVETPIINSPFHEPKEHWQIGGPDGSKRVRNRRPAKYFYRVPETAGRRRRKRRHQDDGQELFEDVGAEAEVRDNDEHDYDFDVNDMRQRIKRWRKADYEGATETTRRLLRHWNGTDRAPYLFFCQIEAAETIIFLVEAPDEYRRGMGEVPRDKVDERQQVDPFTRYACKMATGTGKTTVMGMLAAWSILNSRSNPHDDRFTDTILVMCPSITIRNRLRELDPACGDGSIYWTRDLVPGDMRERMSEGEVMIANWHRLEVKECNTVNGEKSAVTKTGVKTPVRKDGEPTGEFKYLESDTAWMKRIRRELSGGGRGRSAKWMVFNDEAHHAYRRGDAYDSGAKAQDYSTESDAHNEKTATVWIDGLDRISRLLGGEEHGVSICVDMSATPFYLQCTGNDVGRPFPWIVSDFSLLDSIESGLVKIPQLPSRDSKSGGDGTAAYFNIWRHIQEQAEADGLGKRMTPESVMKYVTAPIKVLAEDWKEKQNTEWRRKTPPVFIVVCNSTKISKEIHQWISGARVEGDYLPPPSQFCNEPDKRDVTIRVDTAAFKEIESGEGKATSKLLRFTLDSIGKTEWPGGSPPADWVDFVNVHNATAAKDETGDIKPMDPSIPPGRDIKCIVSVSMLTEGWDANTVTHIAGLRPFGSQLLCEQVIGRALRRQSYDVDEKTGLFSEETATVFGVPFELVPFKTNVVKPKETPRDMNRIFSVQEKEDYRITAPNVMGFVPIGDFDVDVDWGSVPKQSFSDVREKTETTPLPSGYGGEGDVMSLEEVRRNYRRQQVAFILAKNVCDRFMALEKNSDGHITVEALFPKVLPHAIRYLDEKIILDETEDVRDIVIYASEMGKAAHALTSAMRQGGDGAKEMARIPAKRDRTISTDGVDFPSPRRMRDAKRCHLNAMLIDSNLEADAGMELDTHPGVKRWVKNDPRGLGLLVPYWNIKGSKSEYTPDFVVVTDRGINVIVETKGIEDNPARYKQKAAERWVRAVTNAKSHGQWEYIMVKSVGELRKGLDRFCEARSK